MSICATKMQTIDEKSQKRVAKLTFRSYPLDLFHADITDGSYSEFKKSSHHGSRENTHGGHGYVLHLRK